MIPVSALIYECTIEEIKSLPEGFQFLEYDTFYGSLRVKYAGKDYVRHDPRFVYFLFKEPPANWQSPTQGKRISKLKHNAPRRAGSAATCSAPIVAPNAEKEALNED